MFKQTLLASVAAVTLLLGPVQAQTAADLNDLEIAHVAYTADNIDIRYAHLALAISENPAVRQFAETMIRDHQAANDQALALLQKLKVSPQDNFLSQALDGQSDQTISRLSQLRGAEFDNAYAENELAYHQAVNGLVNGTFIPNIDNPEVKAFFKQASVIFLGHEKHAKKMVDSLSAGMANGMKDGMK